MISGAEGVFSVIKFVSQVMKKSVNKLKFKQINKKFGRLNLLKLSVFVSMNF